MDGLCKDIVRSLVTQPFTGTIIELVLDEGKLFVRDGRKRTVFGYELANKTV